MEGRQHAPLKRFKVDFYSVEDSALSTSADAVHDAAVGAAAAAATPDAAERERAKNPFIALLRSNHSRVAVSNNATRTGTSTATTATTAIDPARPHVASLAAAADVVACT